jgi:hypothetical protein
LEVRTIRKLNIMKRVTLVGVFAILSTVLFTGCLGLSIGGGSKSATQNATAGQQLMDLQRAKESGAITEAEYQAQKTKVLQSN